jgi:hypothetical protein
LFDQLEERTLLDSAFPHGGLDHLPDFAADTRYEHVETIANGLWSNPNIWSSHSVPNGEIVIINEEHAVTYDVLSDATIPVLEVNGDLTFRPDINTRLKVGTFLVMPQGSLEIAPATAQVQSEIIFADQSIDLQLDPEQFGTGLIGLGRITIHGTARDAYVELAQEPKAGHSTITLGSKPIGWNIGDRLVFPSSQGIDTARNQWEERFIAAIQGAVVTLNTPLQFSHPAGRDLNGAIIFLPHVANLSRNVIIRSENPSGTRGHTMFVHRADVDIQYASFRHLGRTTVQPLDNTTFNSSGRVTHVGENQIGRYALHMHHVFGPQVPTGPYQYRLIGNAIDTSPRWGIAIHNTHFGLVQSNVVYAAAGAGIVTEDGNETGNVIQNNFVVRSEGSGQDTVSRKTRDGRLLDFGHEGAGYWFRGSNNYIRNNIAASTRTGGFVIYAEPDPLRPNRFPLFAGADTTIPGHYIVSGQDPVVLDFTGNEVYSSRSGLEFAFVGDSKEQQVYRINSFSAWNNRLYGVDNLYSVGRMVVDSLTVLFQFTPLKAEPIVNGRIGFRNAGSTILKRLTLTNANIQGANVGLVGNPMLVSDAYLQNQLNMLIVSKKNTTTLRIRFAAPFKMPLRTIEYL